VPWLSLPLIVAEHGYAATKQGDEWVEANGGVAEPARCRYAKPGLSFGFGNTGIFNETEFEGMVGERTPSGTIEHPFLEVIWGGAASASDVIAVGNEGVIYRAVLPR